MFLDCQKKANVRRSEIGIRVQYCFATVTIGETASSHPSRNHRLHHSRHLPTLAVSIIPLTVTPDLAVSHLRPPPSLTVSHPPSPYYTSQLIAPSFSVAHLPRSSITTLTDPYRPAHPKPNSAPPAASNYTYPSPPSNSSASHHSHHSHYSHPQPQPQPPHSPHALSPPRPLRSPSPH